MSLTYSRILYGVTSMYFEGYSFISIPFNTDEKMDDLTLIL
ncbi:hypothetical protein FM106_14350 [Brachybacterium faecium]|nr:hypothetical protein FM106_14350 [Brachybacterium faecium]